MTPFLKPDESLTHSPREKSTLLANVFDEKQSSEKLGIPQPCHPMVKLTMTVYRSQEIKRLILVLNPYDDSDPDSIIPLFS